MGVMIGVKSGPVFFDRKEILRAIDKRTRQNLSKFGAYTRRRARSSIRKAPFAARKRRGQERDDFRRKASQPGRPPYSQTGILKRTILFGYDRQLKSVVIGPVRLVGGFKGDAPNVLEYGGQTTIRNKRYSPGDFLKYGYGPVAVGHAGGRLTKTADGGTQRITRGRIRTRRQARRAANIHNTIIAGRPRRRRVAPRPFMGPAFTAEMQNLPAIWRDSLKA
jgi:hypothetical protein